MRVMPVILVLAIAISPASAIDFRQRFDKAVRTGDAAQVDQAVAAWTTAEPQNPEIYVKAANYFFKKACRNRNLIRANTEPPRKGEFAIVDSKSGKVVGSLGPARLDRSAALHAANMLQVATQKFPERLDIWFGLAYIYRELDDFDALYATFEEALKYSSSHPTELKWKSGKPLPKDPTSFIPEHVQTYIKYCFGSKTPEGEEHAFRLAKLVADSYPNHPYPPNVIGVYYAGKKDWTHAVSYLEKAQELDPHDTLIMMNLGMIYAELRQYAKARALYEKVIAQSGDEGIRQMARKSLSELK